VQELPLPVPTGLLHFLRKHGVDVELIALGVPAARSTLSAGDGAKGPRSSDWAWVPIRPLREPGKGFWLLARRALTDPADLADYFGYGPAETPSAELVRLVGTRWAIETGFAEAKGEFGLDEYGVRRRAKDHVRRRPGDGPGVRHAGGRACRRRATDECTSRPSARAVDRTGGCARDGRCLGYTAAR
jgi:hypothetical protein